MMAFVLVYLGIGVITAYGMIRWDWVMSLRYGDPSFLDKWALDAMAGVILWPMLLAVPGFREMVFEGLGEDA